MFSRKTPTLKMATRAQCRLLWAKLKQQLRLNDYAARDFIKQLTNKTKSVDMTTKDVETVLNAIDSRLKEESTLGKESNEN